MASLPRALLVTISAYAMLLSLASAAPLRKWTDASGAFSIEAELVEVKDGQAQLKKADGTVIAVPVDKLSEADQKHLTNLSAPKPPAVPPAKPPVAVKPLPRPVVKKGNQPTRAVVFQGVGDLPGGEFESYIVGVSGDGRVVVGHSENANHKSAGFRWTESEGMVTLSTDPKFQAAAGFVSYDGKMIQTENNLMWTEGEFVPYPTRYFIDGQERPVFLEKWAADGNTMVGELHTNDKYQGSRTDYVLCDRRTQKGEKLSGIKDPMKTHVYAISADGSVLVGKVERPEDTVNDGQAFRWTRTGGVELLVPDAYDKGLATVANHISADGQFITGTFQKHSRLQVPGTVRDDLSFGKAFVWNKKTGMVRLHPPADEIVLSYCTGIIADGTVIVGEVKLSPGGDRMYIWDARNGLRLLDQVLVQEFGVDLRSWNLRTAKAASGPHISDDGLTIAGTGDHNGNREGWVVRFTAPLGKKTNKP